MVLHIGMAPGRKHFALETCAHQDGYTREDVYGETLEGDTFWRRKYDAPKTLHPEFVIEDVWRRWKAGLPVRHCINYPSLRFFLHITFLHPRLT